MDTQKFLVAIDDSTASERAVAHIARRMQNQSACHILLLHVPRPIPPKLLEHGGSEDPQEEQRMEAELDAAQAAWRQQITQAAQPIFARARAILQEANIPEQAIETDSRAVPVRIASASANRSSSGSPPSPGMRAGGTFSESTGGIQIFGNNF